MVRNTVKDGQLNVRPLSVENEALWYSFQVSFSLEQQ